MGRTDLLRNMFQTERTEKNTYRCNSPHMCGVLAQNRLFGGQAVSQAWRAVQDHLGRQAVPSTMHYRFVAPGKGDVALDYVVEVLESAIRVNVFQQAKLVGFANFRLSEDLFPSYPLDLDYVAEPDDLPDIRELSRQLGNVGAAADLLTKDIIYDIRPVEWGRVPVTDTPRSIIWSRIQRDSIESIPKWSGLQAVLLLSDFLIIQIAEDIYWSHDYVMSTGASMAHSVRFHRRNDEIDPHGWFLYRVECESIGMDRCKLVATVYDRDRMAVISIIQEATTTPY